MFIVKFHNGKSNFEDAYSVREAVFIYEQGFQNEVDEIDNICTHCVIYNEDIPVACGRFYSEAENEVTIGRIAVLKEYRLMHLGSQVMKAIEEKARDLGYAKAGLSAQCRAQRFYEKLGYTASGEIYLDEHCPHIHMEKKLQPKE